MCHISLCELALQLHHLLETPLPALLGTISGKEGGPLPGFRQPWRLSNLSL